MIEAFQAGFRDDPVRTAEAAGGLIGAAAVVLLRLLAR